HSKDANTQEIINKISSSKYFTIKQIITHEAEIEEVFQKGKIKAVLNFENDFDRNLVKKESAKIQIITDATDPNMANTITNYLNAVLQNYQQAKNEHIDLEYQIIPKTRMIYNQELKSLFMF